MSEAHRDRARIEVRITGRVQGVSYRWYTRQEAQRLAVVGWVQNLPDGSVELVAEGPRADLEALLRFCAQGPPMAAVAALSTDWKEPTETMTDFSIRH